MRTATYQIVLCGTFLPPLEGLCYPPVTGEVNKQPSSLLDLSEDGTEAFLRCFYFSLVMFISNVPIKSNRSAIENHRKYIQNE